MQESILLSNGGAVAASIMFCLQVVIFLGVSITLSVFNSKLHKFAAYSLFSLVLQHTGAVFYFIGDNITQLVSRYDGNVVAAQNASSVFYVLALMVFWITPPLSHLIRETHQKKKQSSEGTQAKHHWCNAIDTITVILKVDVLYSAVLIDKSNSACASAGVYLVFLLCILMGWVYMAIKILVLWYDKIEPAIKYRRIVIVTLIAIIGGVCFPLHTLMNNNLPMDCGFQCSETVENIAMEMTNSSDINLALCSVQHANNAVRLSVTLINLLALTFLSLLFGSAYLTNRFKEEDFKKLMPACCSCTSKADSEGESAEGEGNCFVVAHYWMSKFSWLIVETD